MQPREKAALAVAALWAVPADSVQHLLKLRRPALEMAGRTLIVGRATLPLMSAPAAQSWQAAMATDGGAAPVRFALTGHTMRHMERVAVATQSIEPVLLVGETGTGKTTLVQELAKKVGQELSRFAGDC